MLHIIPVIDLLNGTAVHAKRGQRTGYQPVISSLTASSVPLDIVKAFMDIYPFKTLYIADLNRIQKLNTAYDRHHKIIEEIANAFPELKLWVDAGINAIKEAKMWGTNQTLPILASESFTDIKTYNDIKAYLNTQYTLSLDFFPDGYHGPQTLLRDHAYWPKNVIAMTLSKVGANEGPAIDAIQSIVKRAYQHNIYAAGGVRNVNDLQLLKNIGARGVLISTALHNKTLTTEMFNQNLLNQLT